jgi:RNA polymerase sigma factor (sigma-70 family)
VNGTADGVEFAKFVSRNRVPLVRRYAHHVDGNYADAEDVVQEGLIDLARHWHEVDEPKGWMHRHCERGAIRVIRRRQHRVRGALPLDQDYAESLPADRHNPAADSYAYALAEELVSGPLEWTMLKLHADGCTHAEIAEAVKHHPAWARRRMGCTSANVGKVLRREKERLSREITQRLRSQELGVNEDREMIMAAILTLPKKQREAFGLRLAGFEPVMIARKMSTKPMNARANLSHANRKLADDFGLDPDDATAVPRFVHRSLSNTSLSIVLGATLAGREDLFELVVPSGEGIRGSLHATITAASTAIGKYMMSANGDLMERIKAVTDDYVATAVAKGVAEEVVRHLKTMPDKDVIKGALTIPLPFDLRP